MHNYITDLLIFLLAAVIAVPIFKKFKIGAILAYLFAGIVIGPQALELIEDPKVILNFSELGIVLLLFLIGLELNPFRLWRMRREVFGLGALQVALTGLIFSFIAYLLGLDKTVCFVIGFGMAFSSTAFGIQILQENRQLKTQHGQASFAILLFQDLAVVPLIAIIPILGGSNSGEVNLINFAKPLFVIVTVILLGRFVLRWWFRLVAETREQEVFTATSLLIVISTAVAMEHAGLTMGMGAFIAGMMLANSEYRHELESNLRPFRGLLMGLFFIAVGMSLDLQELAKSPGTVFAIVFGFMLIKALIIYFLSVWFKYSHEVSKNISFVLPQGGEFAFVLFTAATNAKIIPSELNTLLSGSVTISMALTPILFLLNQKYLRTFSEIVEKPPEDIKSDGSKVIIAGYGRFGQIVSRFLKSMDVNATILEHNAAQVDTARNFGAKIFYRNAARADIVESAGGKDAEYFILAIDDLETSVATAKMVRTHFPHLKIIARARNRQHVLELMDLGITRIHRETFLTSLEVAKDVMLDLGEKREHINKHLAKFRERDEEIIRKQYELRNDEKQMIIFTNNANLELETILREDRVNLIKDLQ